MFDEIVSTKIEDGTRRILTTSRRNAQPAGNELRALAGGPGVSRGLLTRPACHL